MQATLQEILDARENRAQIQKRLLDEYQKPLVCFTMNIPGPEKYNRDISIGFSIGNRLLEEQLKVCPVLHRQMFFKNTGCEGYYVVDQPASALKLLAVRVEDSDPIGRLFDIDVLDTSGRKLTREELGFERRRCLLCGNDAAVCARSRAHGLPALQKKVDMLLKIAATRLPEQIAELAYLALIEEVTTTPKPGLVDRNNQGSHPDMNICHFSASANALRPFFRKFAQQGLLTRDLPPKETFRIIRAVGLEAEQAMYAATGGVNTHKGAIFSMGILCAAAGRLAPEDWTPERLCQESAAMTLGVTLEDFADITAENAKTAGEKIYARYGITGIRGQAEDGFPAVLQAGLPVFRRGIAQGMSSNDAGCAALLHLIAATDDTNLIHRSDRETQLQVKEQITRLIQSNPYPTMDVIEHLDREFIDKNLSPGGSADLLAVTYFLHFICNK